MTKITIISNAQVSGLKGPGGFSYELQYTHPASGKTHKKEYAHQISRMTPNKASIAALIHAIECLNTPCEIQVQQTNPYIARALTAWLPVWKKNDWKRSQGRELKNAELWKQLYATSNTHTLVV